MREMSGQYYEDNKERLQKMNQDQYNGLSVKKKKRKKKKESIIDFGNGICLKKKYVTIIEKISEEDIQKMIEYMKYYLKTFKK